MTFESNGRTMSPMMWLTLLGWALSLGIQLGLFWSLKAEVADIKVQLTQRTLTREESDTVHKFMNEKIDNNKIRIDSLEDRIRLLESIK